jgi:hypothetical protein
MYSSFHTVSPPVARDPKQKLMDKELAIKQCNMPTPMNRRVAREKNVLSVATTFQKKRIIILNLSVNTKDLIVNIVPPSKNENTRLSS